MPIGFRVNQQGRGSRSGRGTPESMAQIREEEREISRVSGRSRRDGSRGGRQRQEPRAPARARGVGAAVGIMAGEALALIGGPVGLLAFAAAGGIIGGAVALK